MEGKSQRRRLEPVRLFFDFSVEEERYLKRKYTLLWLTTAGLFHCGRINSIATKGKRIERICFIQSICYAKNIRQVECTNSKKSKHQGFSNFH